MLLFSRKSIVIIVGGNLWNQLNTKLKTFPCSNEKCGICITTTVPACSAL